MPVVHSDACTGCGVCERACPLPTPAIKVFPRKLAQAEPGAHYDFGWRADTPLTQEFHPGAPAPEVEDLDAGLDYLNSEELP